MSVQLVHRGRGALGATAAFLLACLMACLAALCVPAQAHANEAVAEDELVAGAVWDGSYDGRSANQAGVPSAEGIALEAHKALAWYDRIDPKLAVGTYDRQAIRANFAIFPFTPDPTTEEFIESIAEDAREIGQKDDLYASVMIAQAILESGSGSSGLSKPPYNNLFGIKGSYKGHNVALWTSEDDGTGYKYDIVSAFRSYPSPKESLQDYADLLRRDMGAFYAPAWKSNARTYVQACNYLQGHYATDTTYSGKLQAIILTYDLVQYDHPAPKVQTKAANSSQKAKQLLERIALGDGYVATEVLLVRANGAPARLGNVGESAEEASAGVLAQEVSVAEDAAENAGQQGRSPLSELPVSPAVPAAGVLALAAVGFAAKGKLAALLAGIAAR